MLPAIKSILAGFTPAPVPPVPSVPATAATVEAQVSLKHKELSQGKTGAQVERLRAELDAAEIASDHAQHAEGECEVDGGDTTAATEARRQAEDRVRTVKAALSVAMAKHQAAQRALAEATRQASIATDDEANTAFKVAVMELEALWFGEMKRKVEKVAVARQVVIDRSKGDNGVGSAIADFDLWFKVYRDRACAALIPGAGTWIKDIDEKGKHLSSWVDAVSYAMSRRRKG